MAHMGPLSSLIPAETHSNAQPATRKGLVATAAQRLPPQNAAPSAAGQPNNRTPAAPNRHQAPGTRQQKTRTAAPQAGWCCSGSAQRRRWCGWRGSNPRPLASEANTLSTELQPHTLQAHGPQIRLGDYGMAWVPRPATCAQRRYNPHCQTAASPHQAPTGSLLGPKPRPAK